MGFTMKIEDVRRNAYSMPLTNPSFPPGPYRFFNREYFVISYRTDPEALAAVVPEPLEVTRSSNTNSSGCPIPPASATTPRPAR
jgi:acetoacetate decarboxylase